MPNDEEETEPGRGTEPEEEETEPDEETEPGQVENPDDSKAEEEPTDSDSDYPTDYSSYSSHGSDSDSDSFPGPGSGSDSDSDDVSEATGDPDSKKKKEEGEYKGDITPEVDDYLKELDEKYQVVENEHLNIPERIDIYNFPEDAEDWQEEDIMELWADGPALCTKPGWDPIWNDKEDVMAAAEEVRYGKDFPFAPFYVPYRRYYPIIPDYRPPMLPEQAANWKFDRYCKDLVTPEAIIEELDMIEEFLKWVSYVFPGGSTYEGTVWDDVAQGKGVYVSEQGLYRYEGEWLRNQMEGHGVIEVDIPDAEPIPGSKLEKQMRAQGKIIKRDYVHPEDKEWLEMDIEDSVKLAGGKYETPWYEDDKFWKGRFGKKPDAGTYRYAGQWKHSRMHGCGVYEYSDNIIFGRFYFGELMKDPLGCDEENSMLHAGIAEVAAGKARMFINKPDGMVREQRGPYYDPQHPYFYEEKEAWQAPGFVHQFYEVPDVWKAYAHEVDQEREMWLNSFYRSPLRIPMPSELQHYWDTDADDPEFVLVNKTPEPDPEDPTKLVHTEEPLILHTKTGRLINYIVDEEHGLRMFWQPPGKARKLKPEEVEFLPLGAEEFAEDFAEKLNKKREEKLMKQIEKNFSEWLNEWVENAKKQGEMRKQILEKEMELVDLEVDLEEALADMNEDFEAEEREEDKLEKKMEQVRLEEEMVSVPSPPEKEEKAVPKEETVQVQEEEEKEDEDEEEEEEDDDDDDDEDDVAPSSFGSVVDKDSFKDAGKGSGKSPFSSLSLATFGLMSAVRTSSIHQSFSSWRKGLFPLKAAARPPSASSSSHVPSSVTPPSPLLFKSIQFQRLSPADKVRLRAAKQCELGGVRVYQCQRRRRLGKQVAAACRSSHVAPSDSPCIGRNPRKFRPSNLNWLHGSPESQRDYVLSLHSLMDQLDPVAVNEQSALIDCC